MLSALAAYSATLGAEALLKGVIRRQRPAYGTQKDAESSDVGARYSFRSGHAMGAFAAALALAYPARLASDVT